MPKDFNQFMIDKIDALSDKFSNMELRITEKIGKVTEDLRVESRANYVSLTDYKNFKSHVYDEIEKKHEARLAVTEKEIDKFNKLKTLAIGATLASIGLGGFSLANVVKLFI